MKRLAYDVRVTVEVPDDFEGDPELGLAVDGDTLVVNVSGGYVAHAEADAAPSDDERRDALEAAVALTSDADVAAVERELEALRVGTSSAKKVRGRFVERRNVMTWQDGGDKDFAVYEGGFPGQWRTKREAAIVLLREEQRKRMRLR